MTKTIDLSGGLETALDHALMEPPSGIANYGENHAFWLFDDAGRFFSTIHVETIHGHWRNRREFGWIWLPGGELLQFQNEGPTTTGQNVGGACALFRCESPFERWTGGFRGTARATTAAALARAPMTDGPRRVVLLEMNATMAAPPWVMGGISKNAALYMKGDPGKFIGGFRYEQLYRAEVALTIDGTEHKFSATGLRTHRVGPRHMGAMIGHSWMTCVFPSGRAFGLMRFPDGKGGATFSEGFLYQDGKMVEAKVLESPWLTALEPSGERFPIVLETENGRTTIQGTTTATSYNSATGQGTDLAWVRVGFHPDCSLVLAQSAAHFAWDGEEAHGLLERSALVEKFR